jgi:16S rRNA (uracil1498-N3)-methyltransferase
VRARFYLPFRDPDSGVAMLPDEEAFHAVRVLRVAAGDEVEVFDGLGGMWRARITQADRRGVGLTLGEPVAPAPELPVDLTLVAAVLKGDKMDDVVRDAAMVGVKAIQPVVTARAETSLAALARGRRGDRWQRVAVASIKQCGRAVLPLVHAPIDVADYWRQTTTGCRIVLVEPSACGGTVALYDVPAATAVELVVGPEGGWDPSELQLAREAGATLASLGGRTLRADAAPLVAVAALLSAWRML